MQHLAEEHQIEVDVPESLPLVPVDYVHMEQVFTNLLSNSLKYAPANTVVRIHAYVESESIHVQVRIRDRKCRPNIWNASSTSSIASRLQIV